MMKNILTISKISLLAFSVILATYGMSQDNSESKNEHELIMESIKHERVTLINSFEVPTEKLEESIKYWESCRDFLEAQPGYISTKLHQSIKNDARFLLVNVAIWESPQAFMEASTKMSKELTVAPPAGLRPNASLYNVIRE